MAKKPGQPTLRVVRSFGAAVSRLYKSGRSSDRETPVASSTSMTLSAGTFPLAIQRDTLPCDLKPRARAKALCPPTLRQASSNAVLLMPDINAQTVDAVNAPTVKRAAKNGRMSRTPQYPASDFWRRLEDAIGDNYESFNANALAARLDMSQGTVHRWYLGTGLPELKLALRLARQGGVNVQWLLDGVKPKYPISKDPGLRELFEICEQLSPAAREHVLQNARGQLLQQQQESMDEKKSERGDRYAGTG